MTDGVPSAEARSTTEVVDDHSDDGPIASIQRGDVSAELGGVRSVMFIGWDEAQDLFHAMALRVYERLQSGQLVFELPDPEWSVLLERRFGTVCITAQVNDRFVTVEGTLHRVERGANVRLVVEPSRRTFWDLASGAVFREASEHPDGSPRLFDEPAPLVLQARSASAGSAGE